MRVLVTGSAGHLGEGLVRRLRAAGHDPLGIDILPSAFTSEVGSICDRAFLRRRLDGVDAVIHAATLHKPHVATHTRQQFVDTNVTGTLNLLEEAVAARVGRFLFTSTTSAFGRALTPPPGAPAAWVTEEVPPVPRNIYGVTKSAAEDLCQLFARDHGLPCLVLRTSRFFPEEDDVEDVRAAYEDGNLKANEFLYRRVDLEDVVAAHLLALDRAPALGFGKYVISATTPFTHDDLAGLRAAAPAVVARLFPDYLDIYRRRGWRMFPSIERVYVNAKARKELGWRPRWDFARVLECLRAGEDPRSELARAVGAKGYHPGGTVAQG
ncbi:MAG: NAD(P)-dependent oxidoreductase [Planctomycetes bacterium]|nr:NAD(P)-dependent oxidoreductase [Planctomycetota bacterium]